MVRLHASVQKQGGASQPEPVKAVISSVLVQQAPREENDVEVDFCVARASFAPEEEECYVGIFKRFSDGSRGHLSRQGLQRAMHEAGIRALSAAEQQKFKKVQKKVLEYSRGKAGMEEESNPLASKKGYWKCEEFLLMVAGVNQLNVQERWKVNEALACELGLDPVALDEFRQVFDQFDDDGSGSIGILELQKLLALVDLHPTDKELKLLLRRAGVGDELTFTEFLQIMVKVEEFVKPTKE